MIHPRHLRTYVIRPVLGELDAYYGIGDRDAAEELLMLTAAIGSEGGKWLRQDEEPGCMPQAVARSSLGIYGMEPKAIYHVTDMVLGMPTRIPGLPECLQSMLSGNGIQIAVCANLLFATALARLHYYFVPEPLPLLADSIGRAAYWRTYWNAPLEGARHVSELAVIHAIQDMAAAVANYEQYTRAV